MPPHRAGVIFNERSTLAWQISKTSCRTIMSVIRLPKADTVWSVWHRG
jgi:hypothetical protein